MIYINNFLAIDTIKRLICIFRVFGSYEIFEKLIFKPFLSYVRNSCFFRWTRHFDFISTVFTAIVFIKRLEFWLPPGEGRQMAGENLACLRGVYCSNALDLRLEIAGKLWKGPLFFLILINDKVRKEVRICVTIGDK